MIIIYLEKFVEINKNNIGLNINGNKNNLIHKLKEGDYKTKIIIKNIIIDLQYIFYECNNLTNIEEKLKNLEKFEESIQPLRKIIFEESLYPL